MSRKETAIVTILMIASVVIAFLAGYFINELYATPEAELPVLGQAYRILIEHAYDPVPEDPALEYGMIRGMVDAYADPYTGFFEPAQAELQTDDLQGVYGGIGVSLERNDAGQILLYPFPDGPADEAGVLDADVLTAVDDFPIETDTPVDQITAAIRGPEGSEVRISVSRPSSEEIMTFEIERVPVPLPSVTWKLAPDAPQIGLIEVNLIAENTPDEIRRAAEDLTAQGADRYVLDLRDNGGGLLSTGIECARLFLENGSIIQQQYRGQEVVTYEVKAPGPLADLPLVVWVNRNTASAAEICAGALQMNARAPLIGTHTFGKNTIQLVFDLQDGSSIHVTAAKWWFPDLAFPNDGIGLLPDIQVADAPNPYISTSTTYFGLP